MGKKVAGVDVLVYVDVDGVSTVLGGQSGATLNRETNIIEVTSKDANGWADSVAGVRSWSIECEGFLVNDDKALDKIENVWMENGTLDVSVKLPSGKEYTGTAIIESMPLEMPQDDAVSLSISFTGTGALKVVPAPPVKEEEEEEDLSPKGDLGDSLSPTPTTTTTTTPTTTPTTTLEDDAEGLEDDLGDGLDDGLGGE